MMYADNLGRIPPNTALMVVTAGKNRYELRVISSEQKSAVVKFVYQPSQ
jgi:type IV secretory pathway VirB9-like protein